jgi:DNA-binding transcriptional LysR family regulator
MDMRDIQVFRAVMRAGTTSKAAALLNVSQPAISQSIRKLEASSELRLFNAPVAGWCRRRRRWP